MTIPENLNNTIILNEEVIKIAGAGPAGLSAAITLANSGRRVEVHEAKNEVGYRFNGDLQGLENWTTEIDVLQWMQKNGLTCKFKSKGCKEGLVFDSKDKKYEIRNDKPLFYLLERGPGLDSLDTALLNQAQESGVEVVFNSRLKSMNGLGILGTGPRAADAIAVGYHFESKMEDGFWVICDNNLAPGGYAYLLIFNGKGTIKSCMFRNFKEEKIYVDRTVQAFKRLMGLRMINPVLHGGIGNFYMPKNIIQGVHPVIGEQAGFQDTLWGFGMRYAMQSGILAAQSILDGTNYNLMWDKLQRPQIETSMVNRALFNLLGNSGYSYLLNKISGLSDPRTALRGQYRSTWYKRLLLPWAKYSYNSKRTDISCSTINCNCIFCRYGIER